MQRTNEPTHQVIKEDQHIIDRLMQIMNGEQQNKNNKITSKINRDK
jgi:hypothetical protein